MYECTKCGAYVDTVLFSDTGMMCDQCYIDRNPPKMRLVLLEKVATKPLYNMTLKSYEGGATIEGFKKCGWFLRRMRQKNGFTFYDLEFHGTVKCERFPTVHFPVIYPRCVNFMACKDTMTQKAFPENYIG